MTASNPELEARILKDPNDLSAYLVYSDWLSEKGDPRGELIAVQAKLKETPNDTTLIASQRALFEKHGKTWLGPLAAKEHKDHLVLGWHLGFLSKVHVGPPTSAYEAGDINLAETLGELMTDVPEIHFIQEIVIGSKEDEDEYQPTWNDEIEMLAQNGVPKALSRLVFHSGGFWDISSTNLGNLEPLYPRLEGLRELLIHMGGMDFGKKMNLPSLRSLQIETGGLRKENIKAIVDGALPNLEKLVLYIGETDNDYGCDVDRDAMQELLDGKNLGKVTHLGLCNTNLADTLAADIVGSKVLAQLKILELGRGTMTDEGARVFLNEKAAFDHLDRLDLTRGFLSKGVQEELKTAYGDKVVVADQESADDDYRYVQISE